MEFEEAMRRVRAAGWAGVAIWSLDGGDWNGWLIKPDAGVAEDTVLWNHVHSAAKALEQLVEKAERFTYN